MTSWAECYQVGLQFSAPSGVGEMVYFEQCVSCMTFLTTPGSSQEYLLTFLLPCWGREVCLVLELPRLYDLWGHAFSLGFEVALHDAPNALKLSMFRLRVGEDLKVIITCADRLTSL